MKKFNASISPEFNRKIKVFIISDGINKIILSRSYTSLTFQSINKYHSQFLLHLHSLSEGEEHITSFISDEKYFLYAPYSIENGKKLFFILISEASFNPLELSSILKNIISFISSLITPFQTQKDFNSIDVLKANAYDVVLALDDMINPILGNEKLSFAQINQSLKMKSRNAEIFNEENQKKIQQAHHKFIKGMEEIERLKYENKFVNKAISNEQFEQEQKRIQDEKEINEIIEQQKKKEKEFLRNLNNNKRNRNRNNNNNNNNNNNRNRGMNLPRHVLRNGFEFFNEEDRINMNNFINSCENLVQNMFLNQLRSIDDEDDLISALDRMGNIQIVMIPQRTNIFSEIMKIADEME